MNILTIAKKNILELFSERRTVALLFLAPILMLSIVNLLFSLDSQIYDVGYYGDLPDTVSQEDVEFTLYDDVDKLYDDIELDKIDGGIVFSDQTTEIEAPEQLKSITDTLSIDTPKYDIYIKGDDPIKDPMVSSAIISSLNLNNSALETTELTKHVEVKNYALVFVIQFTVFFFSFLIVGIAFLKERQSATLSRTLTYSVSKLDIIIGYLLGYGLMAILQSTVVLLFTIYVLGVDIYGSIFIAILFNALFALVAISLGTLISSFATSEFQIMQFIPLILIPQIVFSGVLPYGAVYQYISAIFPVTYGFDAQKSILLDGNYDILSNVLILILFIIIFTLVNLVILRRIRKI